MAKVASEYEVESIFIEKLGEMGYDFIPMSNYNDIVNNFRTQLCKVNAENLMEAKGTAELTDAEFARVLLRLENHTIYESAKILREQWVLDLDNGKTVYLSFLTDDETRNTYQVTHQVTMDKSHKDDVLYKSRYDVTILINGLPLVQVELKRPGVEINEAINQINRYRRFSFRGLFRYIQVFVVSNSTQTKYFANMNERTEDGATDQSILKSLVFYWTDEENKRINRLIDFTQDFLTKFNVTELLTRYFVIKQSEPVLMVMRPYQIYAVKKAMERIFGSNMNGYVFHTTGSGKTLTSYKLAALLRDDRRIDKVFFLIDRKDLDDQTVDEYNSFEYGCVDNTDSTATLVRALGDSSKTLVVTTIQKMAAALRNPKYEEKMALLRDKRCVFIIDECHRSQFGKMHSSIQGHFQAANYIGFTGTPIFAENRSADGRTTADIFNAGKLDSCIHRYMIKEAIADGNVLRFSVEYMRTINVLHVATPGIDPTQLDDPEYCKRHNIDISDAYHDDQRITGVAEDILTHLERHTHPAGKDVYTAIFATDYGDMFGTNYDLDTLDAYRKDIAKRMKQKELPQIDLLLVVDMFLTGFDSKATNTLILDKTLVWHNLLQAYSRTNRVSKLTKQFGQVVTYRNIKKAQDEALRLYSGDGNPNDYLLESYDYYVAEYRKWTEKVQAVAETPDDAGYLQSENDIRAFILAFRQLSKTLNPLKTFSKFNWDDLDVFMDEATFSDYKSWYLSYYDDIERKRRQGSVTTLADIDFNIELIRTDKINVVYILNLLKDINRNDKAAMEKSIDLILREIERSDNEKLRYKSDIMKDFITARFFDLDPNADIFEAYSEYEHERLQSAVEEFAQVHGIEPEIVFEILHKYFCDEKSVTKESIRQRLSSLKLGLLKLTKLINDILFFVSDMYDKFTSEGV